MCVRLLLRQESFIVGWQVAVAMNNHAWFYDVHGQPRLIAEREYMATVEALHLNAAFAAVLGAGRVALHSLEASGTAILLVLRSQSLCIALLSLCFA